VNKFAEFKMDKNDANPSFDQEEEFLSRVMHNAGKEAN